MPSGKLKKNLFTNILISAVKMVDLAGSGRFRFSWHRDCLKSVGVKTQNIERRG
jgi:hypothetical protein